MKVDSIISNLNQQLKDRASLSMNNHLSTLSLFDKSEKLKKKFEYIPPQIYEQKKKSERKKTI